MLNALTQRLVRLTWRNQSMKIDTDLSIDKLVKIVRIDLIDIDCIEQSVETITLAYFLSFAGDC